MVIGRGNHKHLRERLHTGRKDKAVTEASNRDNGYLRQWEAIAV